MIDNHKQIALKVEAAGGGDNDFNGRVDGRTGSNDNAEGSSQGFVGKVTGDGNNKRIPQSIGGDDNVQTHRSECLKMK